jgi:hypothetical protein
MIRSDCPPSTSLQAACDEYATDEEVRAVRANMGVTARYTHFGAHIPSVG